MKSVLITGAAGHIGSALLSTLIRDPEVQLVLLVDDFRTQRYFSLQNLRVGKQLQLFEMDLSKDGASLSCLPPVDVVYHLAAVTDAMGTASMREYVMRSNMNATTSVINYCESSGIPLVFPSSTSVYGKQNGLVDETCVELQPQSPYAECKLNEESEIRERLGALGCILRLGTIFGVSPGMRFHTAVNKFCWQAAMGQALSVWASAEHQKRPYLALEDAVNALTLVGRRRDLGGQTYNVLTQNATVREVIDAIVNSGWEVSIEMVDSPIMNQLSYEVSDAKIRACGFAPQGSLFDGIRSIMNTFRAWQ